MLKYLFVILFIFNSATAEPLSARIVDFGVYEINRGDNVDNEDVAAGLVISYGKRLIKETDQVEAKIGTNFGFRYILSGSDSDVEVTIKVQHPTPLRNPETGKEFIVSEWEQTVPVGSTNWNTGWIFEKDWEIVPGEWVMQLHVDKNKLIEKKFFIKDGRKPQPD
jgi:Domain of unknown function (DUF3859)